MSNEIIYSEEELTVLKEAARMTLADDESFDSVADSLSISDAVLCNLLEKVEIELDFSNPCIKTTYSAVELITLKESARVTLADADSVDDLADKLDISDTALMRLAEKVQADLDGKLDISDTALMRLAEKAQADLDGATPTESRADALIREVMLLSEDAYFRKNSGKRLTIITSQDASRSTN